MVEISKYFGFPEAKITFFYVDASGKRHEPQKVNTIPGNGNWQIDLDYGNATENIYIRPVENEGVVAVRKFVNGKKQQEISELGMEIADFTFGGKSADDYFYHNENPRVYQVMTIPVDFDRMHTSTVGDSGFDALAGNRWCDPGVISPRIGRSPYQPFPAVLISNYATSRGLVHGTLSQDCFAHMYTIDHAKNKSLVLNCFSTFKAIATRRVKPGEQLTDQWFLGATSQADQYDHLFDRYTAQLRKVLVQPYGATDINRDNVVWGTWNDGIYRDVNEDMVIKEAEFLAKTFPTCRWIQLDDGYAVYDKHAHGIGVPYEKSKGIDKKKFPHGLRGFTDRIRRTGLRPALWIGGFVPVECQLYKEHPEWFMDYSYRVDYCAPLDPSIPEVREYLTSALDDLIVAGGFDAVKHDFWSYAYEDSHDLLRNRDQSGYELRQWWLKEFRKRIASDGYFQTGCDIAMGNPFLGQYFTNYRYGIDIGGGAWENVRTNFRWGIACFATHTGDLFVPNSDSIGLLPGLNDADAMFCVNYCLATHSMVEIAGLLSKNPRHPRFKVVAKAICNPNNGQDVYTAGYDYRRDDIPTKLYFKTGHFTPAEGAADLPVRTIAFFNTDDAEKRVDFAAPEFGLANGRYLLTDVWSGRTLRWRKASHIVLPPHGSRLFAVSPERKNQILDGNMRVKVADGKLCLDYPGKGEFFLSSPVTELKVSGKPVKFKCEEGDGNFRLTFTAKTAGELELVWA